MEKIFQNLPKILITVLVVIAAIVSPIIGFLILVFCVGQLYLSSFKKLNIINSTFYAILTTAALIAALGFFIDFISPYVNQFQIISYINALLVGIYLYIGGYRFSFRRYSDLKLSLSSLGVSALGIVFLLIPVFTYNSAPNLVYFLSSGEDNASHFAMFQRNYDEKSTPYFDDKPTGIIESLKIYPQGIHSFSAFVYSSALDNENTSLSVLLKLYYLTTVLVCAALIFLLSEIVGLFVKKRGRYIALVLSSISVFVGVTLFLAGWGFLTQILAIVYLVSIFYLILIKKREPATKPLLDTYLYGALVIGIVFSWYLLLPVAVALLLVFFIKTVRDKKIFYLAYVPILVACITPILLNIFAGKGAGAINEPGGVYVYGTWAVMIMIVSLAIQIYIVIRGGKSFLIRNIEIVLFIVSSYVLTIGIGAYQLMSIGSLQYYFYKSLYLIMVIAIITIVVFIAIGIARIQQRSIRNVTYVSMAVLYVGAYVLLQPTYPLVYVNNWFSHTITPDDINPAIDIKNNRQSNSVDVLYTGSCGYIKNYILNRWTGAIFSSESVDRSIMVVGSFRNKSDTAVLAAYLDKYPDTIVINKSCID